MTLNQLRHAIDDADVPTIISMVQSTNYTLMSQLSLKRQFNAYLLVADVDYPTAQMIIPTNGGILSDNAQIDRFGKGILPIAAKYGDIAVTSIISLNTNAINHSGNRALQKAARHAHVDVLDDLLLRAVDVDYVNGDGNTALILAVRGNSLACVTSLINAGADPDITGEGGQTALSLALDLGRTDISNYLVTLTVDVNILNSQNEHGGFDTARDNDATLLSALISKGINLEQKNDQGRTMLSEAAITGATDTTRVLINAGANLDTIDNSLRTPLIYATIGNRIGVVVILLYPPSGDPGADISLVDINGKVAADYAIEYDNAIIAGLIDDVGN